MIFPRQAIPRGAVSRVLPPQVSELSLNRPGGVKAVAWLLPPAGGWPSDRDVAARSPVAVWFHGNAEVIDQVADSREVAAFRLAGWSVALLEYRGYGRAGGAHGGSPSQDAIVGDALSLVQHLEADPRIDAGTMVYVGRSLGGGVACALATTRPPTGLVLLTTFTSVASMAAGYGVPSFLVRHPFRNDQALAQFNGPTLIFHGSADGIVPVEHGRALAKIARQATYIEQRDAGHNDFPADFPGFEKALREWLGRIWRASIPESVL